MNIVKKARGIMSIDDKVKPGAKTELMPAIRICRAKVYITKIELYSGNTVCHGNLCTNNCSGYNPDCEYWRREYEVKE